MGSSLHSAEVWTHRVRTHPARVAAPASGDPGVALHTPLPYDPVTGLVRRRVKAAMRLSGC